MIDFLVGLLRIPSPTGQTSSAIEYVREQFSQMPLETRLTPKGVLVAAWDGEEQDAPRAVTAHVDTLGAMISEIKENGRLGIARLGNWVWTSVEGEGVTGFSSKGRTFRGAILPSCASGHSYSEQDRNAPRNESNMEVRIDARTTSADETRALGIQVGDIIAFDPRVEVGESGFVRSRHLDDKAGVAAVYGAVCALARNGLRPKQTTTFHVSTYEEPGHGGASGFPEELTELLVVDMAVVAPERTADEFQVGICAKDSKGPYHLEMRRKLETLAEQNHINYSTDVYPYYASDGSAYWSAGGEAPVGLIGPGVDASHHYERTHREALENTAKLIAAYLLS